MAIAWRRRIDSRIVFDGKEGLTGSLDVTDDGTGLVVHELNADLGNTTARA